MGFIAVQSAEELTGFSFPDMVRVLRGAADSLSIRVIPCRSLDVSILACSTT